ncbi:dienelactone hydrolase family protein [Nocardiopsis sp. N85]|uniref:dienelactone hydrolase family protein n=1 Tax=Nocardiopsis sp. N85 TaxID=3029400 RepID=UPI00237FA230|nr:alpha/beta family hydrolase [Nocardiopsis sp. N85]MDE3720366.1 dienelactone hydrolase family protein [Nocardiopsis sp. N85]
MIEREVTVRAPDVELDGRWSTSPDAVGAVVFAHGSGSSRHSPRNRAVADVLRRSGIATLLFDLLTPEEERVDRITRELRFDIDLLTRRLTGAVDWLAAREDTAGTPIGLFGASTGAAAALRTAAERPDAVTGVVSRGGRPDLAGGGALRAVRAPALFIVGGADTDVLRLNKEALDRLGGAGRIRVVPGATHLFEEEGAMEEVADAAGEWFVRVFGAPGG